MVSQVINSDAVNVALIPSLLDSLDECLEQNNDVNKHNKTSKDLESAFSLFNHLSMQLSDSYKFLEKRVEDLSSELDSVSEQRYLELQEKEQLASRLETLITVLPGGVVVLDHKGMIVQSNPAAECLLEVNLYSKLWREVVSRCFAPKDDDGHEVSNLDGKRISIVTRSLENEGQIILLTDQSETRKLQAQLSRNERLSALGKMVSSLAHQVRTPLSSAMLYANHLITHSLSETKRQDFTLKLINRLHFMERQVRDMLLFVKGDVPLTDRVSVDLLQQTLAEAIEMPLSSYKAECRWILESASGELQCNLDAVVGALLNLVNNSLQSIQSPSLIIEFKSSAQQLSISILDNGPGLSDKALAEVQELFYTTKEQGSGIGLSVVNIVAQSHGGHFTLSNRNEGGACACLTLPLV